MSRNHITSTPRSLINALRFQGILVMDSHAQLQSMLQNNLSAEHALFFAEPVQDAEGKQVDWYSHAHQPLVRLDSLSSEQQFTARDAIERLARDIDALAESLKKDGQGGKFIRGSILSLALQYPGEEFIYMAGSQPVITAWGCGPATVGTQPESLTRFSETASPPPPPPPYFAQSPAPADPPHHSSLLGPVLGFLIGLAMLVGIYFLATLIFGTSGCADDSAEELTGCSAKSPAAPGCSMPFGLGQEKASNATAPLSGGNATGIVTLMTAEKEKEESLRRQLENLRAELGVRIGECPRSVPAQTPPEPKPAQEEPVAPQESPPQPEEEQGPPSLAELMPLTPAEPPKEDPPAATPPKKTPPKPKASPDLVIPDGAIENNDLSFLEGCWNNATMLRDGGTNKPIRSTYCFDKNGRGTRTERGLGHDLRCKGSANARFAGNKLRITATEARCTSSSRGSFNYPKEAIICERTRDGKANCYESQNDRWKAKLQRVK